MCLAAVCMRCCPVVVIALATCILKKRQFGLASTPKKLFIKIFIAKRASSSPCFLASSRFLSSLVSISGSIASSCLKYTLFSARTCSSSLSVLFALGSKLSGSMLSVLMMLGYRLLKSQTMMFL